MSAPLAVAAPARVRTTRARPPRIVDSLSSLWRHRRLIPYFGRRFVERRYARTWLGWIWIPLRPSLDVGARVLLFGGFLGVASGDRPYFMFFIVGMAAWQLFDRTAFWATRGVEMNRTMLGRARISRTAPVVAAVIPGLVDFLLYAVIALCGAGYYLLQEGTSYLVLAPHSLAAAAAGIALLACLGVGVGLWTSALGAETRDVRFVLRYLLGFWFFLTPIIYPISAIPERYQVLAEANPITAPIELVKYGLLSTAAPTWTSLWVTIGFLAVVVASGFWVASTFERANGERV